MRVGCYKDTEFAVEYPEGFWDPVKPITPDGSPNESRSPPAPAAPRSLSPGGGAAAAKSKTSKSSKSASGATKRKLDEKPEVNGPSSPPKKAAVKKDSTSKLDKSTPKNDKAAAKTGKGTPKNEKSTKKDVINTPTKEVKIVLEKHPDLKFNTTKTVVSTKGKSPKEKGKEKKDRTPNDKKKTKVDNRMKDKKVLKKEKGKARANGVKKEAKNPEKLKNVVESLEEPSPDGDSSDYTYDSDDSEMEISFKKKKMESPVKPAKESPKAKIDKKVKVTPKGKEKSIDASKGKKMANKPILEPRAPRIKRTACLNANAIVSALYQTEDTGSSAKSSATPGSHSKASSTAGHRSASPVAASGPSKHHSQPKRRKISIDADLDEGGDEAFDLYLEEYEELAREGNGKTKPSSKRPLASTPKKEDATNQTKEPAYPKKTVSHKKEPSKKETHKKETGSKGGAAKDKRDASSGGKKETSKKRSGESSTYDYDSDDDFGPIPGLYKPLFNRDKSPKKYEIRKTPLSPEREVKKPVPVHGKKSPGAATVQKKDGTAQQKKESTAQKKEAAPQKKETTMKGKLLPDNRCAVLRKFLCGMKFVFCVILLSSHFTVDFTKKNQIKIFKQPVRHVGRNSLYSIPFIATYNLGGGTISFRLGS